LIDEVNKKILDEISNPEGGYTERLNLIKLLYFFFIDLVENNPINIKLSKRILSAFFQDKGFREIQKKVDDFFSEEIFIQEAVELIKPGSVKKGQVQEEDQKVYKEYSEKAKINLIDELSSEKELTIAQQTERKQEPAQEEETSPEYPGSNIRKLKHPGLIQDELLEEKTTIGEEKRAEDLIISPGAGEQSKKEISPEEIKAGIINTLFCEETYKKRIIKKIFRKDEKKFEDTVSLLLDASDWKKASVLIEEAFNKNKIDYFSEEAVKFVDIIQSYFSIESTLNKRMRGDENHRC
jgi:hypothetical protein